MTKKHTALNQGQAAALPETNQVHTMNTQNPDLIQHADGAVALSA